MYYFSNLWQNPYVEKGEGEAKPFEVKEEQAKSKFSRAKKASREFESRPYHSKYAPPPFSQWVKNVKLKSQFSKFLEMCSNNFISAFY